MTKFSKMVSKVETKIQKSPKQKHGSQIGI